jgi:hypothetical protein
MKKKGKTHRNAARPYTRPYTRRNASTRELAQRAGSAVSSATRAAGRRLSEPDPHPVQDLLATAVAGGGVSLLGGYAVRKGVDPKIVSMLMLVGGGAAALSLKGTLRTAATSVCGAGAGQLALTLMQEKAIDELKNAMQQAAMKSAAPPPGKPANALPPGSFEGRLALHSQFAEDAARFTEPEAEYAEAAA